MTHTPPIADLQTMTHMTHTPPIADSILVRLLVVSVAFQVLVLVVSAWHLVVFKPVPVGTWTFSLSSCVNSTLELSNSETV
jgi:hypothetical protein